MDKMFADLNANMLLRVSQSMSLSGTTSEQEWPEPSTEPQVRDAQAILSTPVDVMEGPFSYVFVIDMPGLTSDDIKIDVEHGNMLVISGERKREEEMKPGAKYLRMDRRVGKFLRKFNLPENASTEVVSAGCQHGVLTVTVLKKIPMMTVKVQNIA